MRQQADTAIPKVAIALPILKSLPAGCVAFTAIDATCEPILQKGERVAIDLTDCEPAEGALYLRRYCSGVPNKQLRIVEAIKLNLRSPPEGGLWALGAHRRTDASAALKQGCLPTFCDGPFRLNAMQERIVGRVVAILRDDAAEIYCVPNGPDASYELGPL